MWIPHRVAVADLILGYQRGLWPTACADGLFGKKFNKHGQNGVTIRASCDSLLEMQEMEDAIY